MAPRTKLSALATGLATLVALAFPFAGAAMAAHGAEPIAVVDLEPEQDSASTGTCNTYTVTAVDDDGDVAEAEVIDVQASQEFPEQALPTDPVPALAFCTPADPGGQAPTGPTARTEDTDCPTDEGPNEDCRIIHGEFTTDAQGRVVFGITSDTAGEVQVTAFAEGQDPDCPPETVNNEPDAAAGACEEPQDTAVKTFTEGGPGAAQEIDCEPEFATNNLDAGDTEHTFTCTVVNQQGDPLSGVTVDFVITAGPNADNDALPGDQGPFGGTCTTATGAPGTPGEATCTYNENIDLEAGETGTDTILAFVDQDADGDPEPNEPSDEIEKAWTTAPRNIDCQPNTDTNNPGDEPHEVTCLVTDAEGSPVGDVQVTFTESGVGRFEGNAVRVTDDQGQVTITSTAQQNEEGTQEITGTITDEDASAPGTQGGTTDPDAACNQPANDPNEGDPAGNCAETVLKNWTEPGPPPPEPECSDGEDNDGDGEIDFPDDPGCTSAEDDSERDDVVRGPCADEDAIVGTENNDVLVGTEGNDIICGRGGDDSIRGRPGDDILLGQGGDDTIRGGSGRDTLRGGTERDTLTGGGGKDVVRGGQGPDSLKGNKGHDTLRGGRGHDVLRGGFGNDTLRGGRGNDTCRDRYGDNIFRNCERR